MKHRTLIILSVFLLLNTGIYFLYYLKKPRNHSVILITVDSLRADHLGCYGYERDTSPNIDILAKNSTLYINAFSQSSRTVPSNYSLLTSLYPLQHKMNSWGSIIDTNIPTLISVLYNNGYSIGIFGNQDLFLRNIKKNFGNLLKGFKYHSGASLATKEALEWIELQKNQPFFLWIYYLDPHRPYNPPPPHDKLYSFWSNYHLPIRNIEADYIGGWDYIPNVIVENGVDNPNYYIAKYDGEIHYIDDEVGKLLKGLKEKGLFNESLIIFTSDHGESLGEHHLYFNHRYTLFNEIIRVPLIIKEFGQMSGKLIRENAALIDIFPTILKKIGIKINKGMEGVPLRNKFYKKRVIISQNGRMISLISGKWKLIKYRVPMGKNDEYIKIFFPEYPDKNYQLFNIENDPLELINLTYVNVTIYQEMELALSKYEDKIKFFKYKSKSFKLDEEYKKRLKTLGYAQ